MKYNKNLGRAKLYRKKYKLIKRWLEKRGPKCKGEKKAKNGLKNGIKRYKCKTCGYNYTKSTPHGYPIEVKREALRYYLEGIGFRRIERLLGVNHTEVIYWVKNQVKK